MQGGRLVLTLIEMYFSATVFFLAVFVLHCEMSIQLGFFPFDTEGESNSCDTKWFTLFVINRDLSGNQGQDEWNSALQ